MEIEASEPSSSEPVELRSSQALEAGHEVNLPDHLIPAVHYYYKHQKIRASMTQCPKCGGDLGALKIFDRISGRCPHCGTVWNEEDLVRLTQEDVARLLEKPGYEPSRSEVQRLLSLAEELGVVQVVITRPVQEEYLRNLEEKLRQRFPLVLVRIVQGRNRLFDDGAIPEGERRTLRNSVLLPAAKAAGEEILGILQRHIEKGKEPTLCLSWGYTVNLIVQELRPSKPMPKVTIAPFVGALTKRPFELIYDSNLLVQRAAEVLHAEKKALWLLAPALVRTPKEREIMKSTALVKQVLEKGRSAELVAVSIARADETDSNIRISGLLAPNEIREMVDNGAVGEIGGHYFDRDGEAVDGIHPIGLNLDDLKSIVHDGRVVLALVAADKDRVGPLLAAINAGLINALVTDHVTAENLLKESIAATPQMAVDD